ncbi:MAG: alpha/beta hydrolase [Thermodesulfobacteriota bacterium]|nr:alpha/beta hydrolase [Thermodesulfobacteriota bacterium]
MAYISRNGIRLYYEKYGTGPTILLTHGYAGTSEMWEGQVKLLAHKYSVISWDMRGHGRSDSPDDQAAYSEGECLEDMAALLDNCEAGHAVIAGLSLGGYMSMAFYQRYPERVRALMLFDTGPGYRSGESRAAWNRSVERSALAFERKGLDALKAIDETRARTHRSALGLSRAARGMLAQFDSHVIDSLHHIRVPTMVLVGSRDKPLLSAATYMAEKIPQGTKIIIPDAGHIANLDQPDRFNEAVGSFLSSL